MPTWLTRQGALAFRIGRVALALRARAPLAFTVLVTLTRHAAAEPWAWASAVQLRQDGVRSAPLGHLGCALAGPNACLVDVPSQALRTPPGLDASVAFLSGSYSQLFRGASVSASAVSSSPFRSLSLTPGFVLGTRWSLLDGGWASLAISSGMLRNQLGVSAAWSRFELGSHLGPLRLTGVAQTHHVFAPGRDAIDFSAVTAASYALAPSTYVAVECRIEDLEGVGGSDAERGSSESCGPVAAFDSADRQFRLAFGTLSGWSGVARTIGRASLSYSF